MDFGTNWVNIHRQFYNYETGRHKVDKIKVDSIKNIARQKRGISSTKFNITDFQMNIPQCKNWNEFLNESEYKDHLIEMIKLFVLEFGFGILPRSTQFIYYFKREREYFVSHTGSQVINGFNHENADTRLVLQGSKVDSNVVVVCKDPYFNDLGNSKLNITNDW